MLAIILTGAALIRERENGTLEHLLVMPVNSFEIMASKIWSMMLVVLTATALSLIFVIRIFLEVPIEGSIPLFLFGVALHLFAATSLGIFLASILYRGAGLEVVWKPFLILFIIGGVFFAISLAKFRKSVA